MNSTGKNLEQHEILKVKLLRNLDGDISSYMRLWNLLSGMNKLLIRKREGETEEQLHNRKNYIFSCEMDSILSSDIINGLRFYRREDGSKPKSIREIKASPVMPKEHHEMEQNTSSVLTFPQLLLLTLYWKIKDDEKQGAETQTPRHSTRIITRNSTVPSSTASCTSAESTTKVPASGRSWRRTRTER